MKDYEKLQKWFDRAYLLIIALLLAIIFAMFYFGVVTRQPKIKEIKAPEPVLPEQMVLDTNDTMSKGDYNLFLHIYHQVDELDR